MAKASENLYAVILAGGGGTRLWPKSRKNLPKHLLKLIGKDTLLKITHDRIAPVIPPERIFIVTLNDYVPFVKKELPSVPIENILIEPQAKNTALAMGFAATCIHKIDPSAVIINLAADHIYKNIEKFQETALAALEVALETDNIVAIGITPEFPHTGLGYIRTGEEFKKIIIGDKEVSIFHSRGFKEKPDLSTAESFLATGEYLWNANLYCWSTKTILNAFKEYSPETSKQLDEIYQALTTPNENETIEKVYDQAENIQIDYAVSEKAQNMIVIPGDFGWSDIGDWKILYETLDKDAEGNAVVNNDADYININSKNCLIEADKLIVTIGLDNIVIVETEDAILVCAKDKAQDVKKAVEKLKELKKDKYL